MWCIWVNDVLLLYGHKLALAEKAMLQGKAPTAGISSNNKAGYLTMLLLGGLFLAFGAPVSYLAINDELAKGNYAVLLVLVFPLIGALLMWQGRSKLKLWQKIGKTPFFADPFPGNAGGQIGGYFQLAQGKFVNPPQCVLRCLHKYDSGSGKTAPPKPTPCGSSNNQPVQISAQNTACCSMCRLIYRAVVSSKVIVGI